MPSPFLHLQAALLLFVLYSYYAQFKTLAFTVIMSDSGVPSALIDGPQSGFTMSSNSGARTDAREQEAVYDIMRATGNDWATEIPDVCRGRWHGIECMPDKDNVYHVVSLSFGALSDDTAFPTCDPTRSPYISESITKLPHIRTLFFYRCFSSSNPQPIPAFLGRLGSTLQTLVLRENGHVGPVPTELGNLTRLRVLDLHRNNLNGSIPVSLNRISGLRSLDLSWNRLSSSLPDISLSELNVLDLNQNLLTGSIPSNLGTNCRSLVKIDFSRNRLGGLIPDSITGLKDLILMDLSYNCLSGPLPSTTLGGGLSSLQALILKGNSMGSINPTLFDGMKDLMILILSNTNLNGQVPESLGRLRNLRVVYLDGNRLNGSIPSNFRELKHLTELRLNDNYLTGPVPFGREMVWRMRRKLKLHNNSGLCYTAGSGFDGVDSSSFELDIGLCETIKTGSTRTVQHFSTIDVEMSGKRSIASSATASVSAYLITFVLLILVLL